MIVWGGGNGSAAFNTGARYDPGTNSWTATSTDTPVALEGHRAVWTGSQMIVWGGDDGTNAVNTGGRYYPDVDRWASTSTANAPDARAFFTAVWTGSEMVIWGGIGAVLPPTNTGGRYCVPRGRPRPTPHPRPTPR